MKTIEKQGCQGDVLFRRVERVPEGFVAAKPTARIVVAHSETGHHHAIDDTGVVLYESKDPLVCYLSMETADHVDVVHHRSFDTHETMRLGGGVGAVWEVRRQREWAPEGWRRVED